MRTPTRRTLLVLAAISSVVTVLLPSSGVVRTSLDERVTRAAPVAVTVATDDRPAVRNVAEPTAPTVRETEAVPEEEDADAAAAEPANEPQARPAERFVQTTEIVYSEHVRDHNSDDAAAAESGPCPKATTCNVHALQGGRWKTDTSGTLKLRWKFNDDGRRNLRAPEGLLESAISSGMAQWRKWNSNISWIYDGTTTAKYGARGTNGTCDDGTNVIGWARLDPKIIAQVITCLDQTGRRVVDADLALNVTQHWEDIQGEPESRHTFDIRSIVTHELGHVLSLADLYSSDALYQTMMGNAKYGETRKRTLALGDVLGIQAAYPCGDGDTCPRKGIVDD
jgi:hypothetical protein